MTESLKHSFDSRPRFNSVDDIANCFSKSLEKQRRRFLSKLKGNAEAYRSGELELVVRVSQGSEEFNLIFLAIPKRIAAWEDFGGCGDVDALEPSEDCGHDLMTVPVPYLVES